MQLKVKHLTALAVTLCAFAVILFAQQPGSSSKISITGVPSEPITPGTCTSSTFGYVELNGKRADFSDADFGSAIKSALRQGYVLTIYPPTKSGIFINQECHSSR